MVARAASTREIAETLCLSPRTVEAHVAAILRKFGIRSRATLVAAILGPPAEPIGAGQTAFPRDRRIARNVNDKVVPNKKFRRPIHPGVMLQNEFLAPLGVTTQAFATHVGVPVAEIDAFVRGDRDLSPSLAIRVGNAVGTSVQMWLNMQMAIDLYDAMQSPDGEAATKVRVLPAVEESLKAETLKKEKRKT